MALLSTLALVSASAPASVARAEPEGATPGSGRGAAAVIAAGGFHSCAVLENGSVRCWGDNDAGQLGYGDTNDRGDNAGEMGDNLASIELGAGRTATAIAAGSSHSCALLDSGAVKCWGDNDAGELGQGNADDRGDNAGEMGDNLAPIALGAGRTATAIAAGDVHSCALLDSGAVKCWGANDAGQLGQGDTEFRGDGAGEMGDNLAPVGLGVGRTATAITAGGVHTCALLDDGSVKCWGDGAFGQLGTGAPDARGDGAGEMGDDLAPIGLGSGRTAVAITAGDVHTCALLDNGSVKCWGFNLDGELGYGDTDARGDAAGEMGDFLGPVGLGSGRTAVAIAAGDFHTCALLDNDTAKCWGINLVGQLGFGDTDNRGDVAGEMGDGLDPVDVGTGRTAVAITAGDHHTCALLDNGSVKCWGWNIFGQLGYGDTDDRGDDPSEMGNNLASVQLHSTLSVVPADAAPARPSGLSALAGPERATLAWSAPGDNGGQPITGYRIESSTDGVSWAAVVADTGSTTTSFAANGLTAGIAIRFRVAAINAVGVSPPTLPTVAVVPTAPGATADGDVVSLTPARLLDTRAPNSTVDGSGSGGGPATAGSITEVQVAGRGGVPVDAMAAVLNVTVVAPAADAFATVFPCGQSVPTASNVNYRAGVDIANAVIVQLGDGGKACIYTFAATHLLADVNGYAPAGGSIGTLLPARLLDTRAPNSTVDGSGSGGGPATAGSITEVQVAGRGGVPADAVAAVLNVTVVGAAADAFATVFPCGQSVPTASNVNYRAGVDIANAVIVQLGDGGKACIYTFAATHLLADVSGSIPVGATLGTLVPARLLDTRAPNSTVDGAGSGGGPVAAGSVTEVQVAGRGGVPADAVAAVLNVTVVGPAADAFATVFPCDQSVPTASNVNYRAGVDIANAVVVKLDPAGKACIFTFAATHLLADVNGFLTA